MKDPEKLMHISSANRLIRKNPTEMVSLCPSDYLTKKTDQPGQTAGVYKTVLAYYFR